MRLSVRSRGTFSSRGIFRNIRHVLDTLKTCARHTDSHLFTAWPERSSRGRGHGVRTRSRLPDGRTRDGPSRTWSPSAPRVRIFRTGPHRASVDQNDAMCRPSRGASQCVQYMSSVCLVHACSVPTSSYMLSGFKVWWSVSVRRPSTPNRDGDGLIVSHFTHFCTIFRAASQNSETTFSGQN